MKNHSIAGRVIWMLYACPITLLLLLSVFVAIQHYGPRMVPWVALDFLISFLSLVALFLHIWDTPLFVRSFWKIYAFVFIAWDLLFNLLITPAVSGDPFEPADLIGFTILLPLFVALFRYAFRDWNRMEE